MPNYEQLLEQAHDSLADLQYKLGDLDNVYQEIIALKEQAQEIPTTFNQKFVEVKELSDHYVGLLGKVTETFLNGNNSILTSKLSDLDSLSGKLQTCNQQLQEKVVSIQSEIKRMEGVDYDEKFSELQKKLIEKTSADLAVELGKIEEKTFLFQDKINSLQTEVNRLEQVDLAAGFRSLQDLLSQIFQAIIGINNSLTAISGSLNSFQNDFQASFKRIDSTLADQQQQIGDLKVSTQALRRKTDEISLQLSENRKEVDEKFLSLNKLIENKWAASAIRAKNQLIATCAFGAITIVLLALIFLLKK